LETKAGVRGRLTRYNGARYDELVNFEWDPGKARQNRRKHRVSFQEAASVFGDPLGITYLDPEHSTAEQRFITVGMSSAGRVLIIAHADREANIRIISARKTTQRERKHYEEEN
jgi:uncharacterized DUF497 family protein